MITVDSIVGNTRDAQWQQRLAGASVDVLTLDGWEAQKSQLQKSTRGGAEVTLSLDRDTLLHSGDILAWDAPARQAIVVRIEFEDVLVVNLRALGEQSGEIAARICFELGHALGQQRWPAVVKGSRVYIPLSGDRDTMTSIMKTHAGSGITYEFVAGGDVIPYLTPQETRRLFSPSVMPEISVGTSAFGGRPDPRN